MLGVADPGNFQGALLENLIRNTEATKTEVLFILENKSIKTSRKRSILGALQMACAMKLGSAVPLICALCDEPDPITRVEAINALGLLGNNSHLASLQKIADKNTDNPNIATAALRAIANILSHTPIEFLSIGSIV